MVELCFIQNFIAEFAFAVNFITILFGSYPPTHSKSTFRGLFGVVILLFFMGVMKINFLASVSIYSILILYGAYNLNLVIKYKGRKWAIEEYGEDPKKPKYGINNTLERINNIIKYPLFACILSIISIFLGSKDVTTIIGILFLLSIFVIMGNHFMKGHTKYTTNIDPNKVKVNLFTLLSLTLILSLMILVVLSFSLKEYFPNFYGSYPFVVLSVVVPPLYVSNYLLDQSRLTFFRNEDIAKIFISNIFLYSILSVLIVIILSDIPVAFAVFKRQDTADMILWTNGFILFIAHQLTIIFKKSLLFRLESNILNLSELESLTSE